jgi:hypothetical protein
VVSRNAKIQIYFAEIDEPIMCYQKSKKNIEKEEESQIHLSKLPTKLK